MTWKQWSTAAANAFISGLASSLTSFTAASLVGVDAKHALEIAGVTALGSGIVSAAKWVAQHKLPGTPAD